MSFSRQAELLWLIVRLHAHLIWLRINKALAVVLSRPPVLSKRIAVIGDGVAEGVGDWVTLGSNAGIARHLQTLISTERTDPMRLPWVVSNLGHAGSTLEDWMPGTDRKPRRGAWAVTGPLFRRALAARADVYIVALGANDHDADPVAFATQLAQMTDALRSTGATVVLLGLPNAAEASEAGEMARRRDTLIRRIARKSAREHPDNPVLMGPSLSVGQPAKPGLRTFNGMHLGSAGYKFVARSLFHQLETPMKRKEFHSIAAMTSSEPAQRGGAGAREA